MKNKVLNADSPKHSQALIPRKCSLCSQTGHDKRSCTNNFEIGDLVKMHYHRNLRQKGAPPRLGFVTSIRNEEHYGAMGPYVSVTWFNGSVHSGAHACYLRLLAKA